MSCKGLFLLLTFVFSSALAGEVCSLVGVWYDSHSVPNSQLLFRIDKVAGLGLAVFALTPNPSWGTGVVEYKSSASNVSMFLDSGERISGTLDNNCTAISWTVPRGSVWIRAPDVQRVHVVFMNHLDVGYASFIGNILNEYFTVYFPRAARLAAESQIFQWNNPFIYTTHPWLISLYLDCPPNLVLSGIRVQCPTDIEIVDFVSAIEKGYIVWHAGPMNMQVELMNSAVLEAGLLLSANLNKRFKKGVTVLSQRDVPGMTICALPLFTKYGIRAVSVGVNPGTAPPAVPKIFQWKFQDQASVLGLWHAGGYPLNPGPNLVQAGGISIQDCTVAPGTGHALCFAFRTDNTGPPTSLEEVDTAYQILQEQFPHAAVYASTLDQFVDMITPTTLDLLPTVEGEIGDTWIQGIAADPRKMAEYRAAARGLQECVSSGDCNFTANDPVLLNATRFLVKLPEHTWGLPGIHDTVNWTNAQFEKARSKAAFTSNEDSWSEQRVFLNLTLDACKGHPLYNYITKELTKIIPQSPDLSNFKIVTPESQTFSLFEGQVLLGYNTSTGAINNLTHISKSGGTFVHATDSSQLGVFSYHTYNETDFDYMASIYSYFGNAGYDKPNVTDNAHPESKTWLPKLIQLYRSTTNPNTFLIHLRLANLTASSYYGAPAEVWVSVTISLVSSFPYSLSIDYELNLLAKMATRLPEATMFSFYPNPQGDSRGWECMLGKVSGDDQIVTNLDSVVLNGSHYQHAVEYVSLIPPSLAIKGSSRGVPPPVPLKQVLLTSQDVPLVCPIFRDGWTPTPFPVPLAMTPNAEVAGVAFNVHNNIWNTNYPLYYPFQAEDQNIKARFSVAFVVE